MIETLNNKSQQKEERSSKKLTQQNRKKIHEILYKQSELQKERLVSK